MDRRGIVASLLWGIIAALLGAPAAAYLLTPPRSRDEADWAEAGSLGTLPPGKPAQLVFRRIRADGWKISSEKTTAWVVRTADNQVVAFAPQCTHLGCGYHWDQEKQHFLCPCHSSVFSIDGEVLGGPAPRPLDRYEAKVVDGRILLRPPEQQA